MLKPMQKNSLDPTISGPPGHASSFLFNLSNGFNFSVAFLPFGAALIPPASSNQLSPLFLEKGFNETLITLF